MSLPVVNSFATQQATDASAKLARQFGEYIGLLQPLIDRHLDALHDISDKLDQLIENTADNDVGEPQQMITLVGGSEYTVRKAGKKYYCLFTSVPMPNFTVNLWGLSPYVVNLTPGWNTLDFPEGTVFSVASGTFNVLERLTDDLLGNAI